MKIGPATLGFKALLSKFLVYGSCSTPDPGAFQSVALPCHFHGANGGLFGRDGSKNHTVSRQCSDSALSFLIRQRRTLWHFEFPAQKRHQIFPKIGPQPLVSRPNPLNFWYMVPVVPLALGPSNLLIYLAIFMRLMADFWAGRFKKPYSAEVKF